MKKFGLLALAAAMLVACNNATNPVVSDPISSVEESSISQPIESEPSESEPSVSEPVELELLMPEEAINYIASAWEGEGELIEEGVWGAAAMFAASEYAVADIKLSINTIITPEQFLVVDTWAVDADNVWSITYINEVDTVLEYYVYADIVYLDASGNIEFEQAEGLTPLNVTCLEVYGYTYVEPTEPVVANDGSAEHPFTISEGYAIAAELEVGANTDQYYFTGTITGDISWYNGRISFDITDGESTLRVYNMNNAENKASFVQDNIGLQAGDVITVTGALKNFNGTLEICYVKDVASCYLVA